VSNEAPALSSPDEALFRHVLGHYPTGVSIITAVTPDGPVGMAMNSFTSVSVTPPLVLFCPAASSTTWPVLRTCDAIAINVLAADQEPVSRLFAKRGVDRFAEIGWRIGENGAPLLNGALGWLECSVQAEYPAGDHTVVTAEISKMGLNPVLDSPLVFFRSAYFAGVEAAGRADH
jgi:3-hydroxy-9,10-secoandrosta-1,3,5(10)-triene-9,17-dione monooxygenase reductase component